MAAEILSDLSRATDSNSSPLSGAKWYFYASGGLTPQSVYTTAALDVAHANPVVADSGGLFAPIYFDASLSYRGILKTAAGATIRDVDPINAGLASQLAAATGSASVGFKQAGAGAVARTMQDKARDEVSVKDFGAAGDGATDDTAAIQAAIDSLAATGGSVRFPRGRYLITSTVTVSSLYPISLIGEQFGHTFQAVDSDAPSILVGAPMTYGIVYEAPDALTRNSHGGGVIEGLFFADVEPADAGSPGTNTVTAFLYLKDFSLSAVERCHFQWIKGGAVLTEFCTQTTIRGCTFRYNGDLASPSRSVVKCVGTSTSFTTQSFMFDDCRMEVNYSDYYFETGAFVTDIQMRSCFFEASTDSYPNSSKTFVNIGAENFELALCKFNRTVGRRVIASNRGKIIGCTFNPNSAGSATESLQITGGIVQLIGCSFRDIATGFSVASTGVKTLIQGCSFESSGGIDISGRGSVVSGCTVRGPTKSSGYFLQLGADEQIASGNHFDDNGVSPSCGGIIAYGNGQISGNHFDRWAANTAIRRENAATAIHGNSFAASGVATPYGEGVAATGGFRVNGTKVVGAQGAAVADATDAASAITQLNALLARVRAHGLIA